MNKNSVEPTGNWLFGVVFIAGAALMAFEIAGSRILAPYFGNSIFVWGSLIGVFLAALATGYALGGRLADRFPTEAALGLVLSIAALLIAAAVICADPVQSAIAESDFGVRLNPLLASLVLFTPSSVLLGIVSPMAVRLKAGDIESVGSTAGLLYGVSTLGSIFGTIGAAFWLVEGLGTETTVLVSALLTGGAALVTIFLGSARRVTSLVPSGVILAVVALIFTGIGDERAGDTFSAKRGGYSPVLREGGYSTGAEPSGDGEIKYKKDSQYHRIRVVDYDDGLVDDKPTRALHFDSSLQAGTHIDGNGKPTINEAPIITYQRVVDLIPVMNPEADRVLMIGLGSGVAAMRLHSLRPDLTIDVVEIDPAVVDVAKDYFGYRDGGKIRTHVGDGRTWLSTQDKNTFDAIWIDTYFSDSIPFHMTTVEFLELVKSRLKPDGVAGANLIGAVEGQRSKLFRALHNTWSNVFEDVIVYPILAWVPTNQDPLRSFTNIELFAAPKRGVLPPKGSESTIISQARIRIPRSDVLDKNLLEIIDDRYVDKIGHKGVDPLTDDLAPVDSMLVIDGI